MTSCRFTENVVGIWASTLQSERPRGLQRVARKISQCLLPSKNITYVAVIALSYDDGQIYANTCLLSEYIMAVPWQTANPRQNLEEEAIICRKIPLEDLSAIVSFECFDEVWQWPLKDFDVKSVCVVHDLIPFRITEMDGFDSRSNYYKALSNAVIKSDIIVCVSKSTERDLLDYIPQSYGKTKVIYNGYGSGKTVGFDFKRSYYVNKSAINIVMLGTVEERKNHLRVLSSLPQIKARYPSSKLTLSVIGDNPGGGHLFGNKYKLALEEAQQVAFVEFTGHVSDEKLQTILQDASVLVFSSLWEGFGIPILEAFDRGVPVVASNVSSHPEVGGEYAIYCDPYSPSSIAEAIFIALEEDVYSRVRRQIAARAWALRYTWKEAARAYTGLLNNILGIGNTSTQSKDHFVIEKNNYETTKFEKIVIINDENFELSDPLSWAIWYIINNLNPCDRVIYLIDSRSNLEKSLNYFGNVKLHPSQIIVKFKDISNSSIDLLPVWIFYSLFCNHSVINIKDINKSMISRIICENLISNEVNYNIHKQYIESKNVEDPIEFYNKNLIIDEFDSVDRYGSLADAIASYYSGGAKSIRAARKNLFSNSPLARGGVSIAIFVETREKLNIIRQHIEESGISNTLIISKNKNLSDATMFLDSDDALRTILINAGSIIYINGDSGPLQPDIALAALLRPPVFQVSEKYQIERFGILYCKDFLQALNMAVQNIDSSRFTVGYEETISYLKSIAATIDINNKKESIIASHQIWERVARHERMLLQFRNSKTERSLSNIDVRDVSTDFQTSQIKSTSGKYYIISRTLNGEYLAGIQELAEAISACMPLSEWADLAKAWENNLLEQVFRTQNYKYFDYAIYIGEEVIGSLPFDPTLIYKIKNLVGSEQTSIVVGGDYSPLPNSNIFVTGKISNAAPAIAASNAAIVPQALNDIAMLGNVRAVLRFFQEDIPIFIHKECFDYVIKEFPNIPINTMHVYQDARDFGIMNHDIQLSDYEAARNWLGEKTGWHLTQSSRLDLLRLRVGEVIHRVVEKTDVSSSMIEFEYLAKKSPIEYVKSVIKESISGICNSKTAIGLRTKQPFWVMANESGVEVEEKLAELFGDYMHKNR